MRRIRSSSASADSGCCTRGVHEFEIESRRRPRAHIADATVPAGSYPDAENANGLRDAAGKGDFRLIDITDPRSPFEVSTWKAGGRAVRRAGLRSRRQLRPRRRTVRGRQAGVPMYWDSGYIRLDLTDPAQPVYTGRAAFPTNADDAHSSQYDEERPLLFSADEDFQDVRRIEKGFGYMRVWDFRDPATCADRGVLHAALARDRRSGSRRFRDPQQLPRRHDALRVLVLGRRARRRWGDPRSPREVAYFVPPATENPVKPSQRGTLTNTTQVGCRRRRGHRPRLRERHELRSLDPAPHGQLGIEAAQSGAASQRRS